MQIQFQCECGQAYSAKPSMADKSIRCRKCERTIRIPLADAEHVVDEELQLQPEVQLPSDAANAMVNPQSAASLAVEPKSTTGFSTWLKEQLAEEEDQARIEGIFGFFSSANPLYFLIAMGAGAFAVGISFFLQRDMDGPAYLTFYAAALAGVWILSEVFRTFEDTAAVAVPAAMTFVAIGLVRYGYGVTHGMQRFTILFIMMVVGGLLILVGAKRFVSSENSHLGWRVLIPIGVTALAPMFLFFGPIVIVVGVVLLLRLFRGESSGGGGYFFGGGCGSGGCGGGGCGGGGCGGGGCGGCGG